MSGIEEIAISIAGSLGATSSAAAIWGEVAVGVALTAQAGVAIYSAVAGTSNVNAPKIGDKSVQSSARGVSLPVVWGSMRLSGNLIQGYKYEDTFSSGGKGFSGAEHLGYRYFADFGVAICEGPITSIRKIWLNNKLYYNMADDASLEEIRLSIERKVYMAFYLGTDTQTVDPVMQRIAGYINVPPYRHTAYIVFNYLPLEDFGNAIPSVSVEVTHGPSPLPGPTLIDTEDTGGLYATNICGDPDRLEIYKVNFDNGNVEVFDDELNRITEITLPQYVQNSPVSTPVYCNVGGSDVIAVSYRCNSISAFPDLDKTYHWSAIALISADTKEILYWGKVSLVMPGPMAYLPFANLLLQFDGQNSGGCYAYGVGDYQLTVFKPYIQYFEDTNGLLPIPTIYNFGDSGGENKVPLSSQIQTIISAPSLVFHFTYLDGHKAFALSGFGNWLCIYSETLYNADGQFQLLKQFTGDFDGNVSVKMYVEFDKNRDLLYWCTGDPSGGGGAGSKKIYKIDLSKMDINVIELPEPDELPYVPTLGFSFSSLSDQMFLHTQDVAFTENFFCLNPETFEVLLTQTSLLPGGGYTGGNGFITPIDGLTYVISSDFYKIPISPVVYNQCVPLSEIVSDICLESGLIEDEIDVTELTDCVHGFMRANPAFGSEVIAPLMSAYFFDAVESNYKLKFVKRGHPSALTIPEDYLAAHEYGSGEMPTPLKITRLQEVELPNSIEIKYISPDLDYQVGTQIEKRNFGSSLNEVSITYPICLSAEEAKQITEKQMNIAWAERLSFVFSLPLDGIKLEATDIVTVQADYINYLVRITKTDFATGIIVCEALSQKVMLLPDADEYQIESDPAPIWTSTATDTDELPEHPIVVGIVPNTKLVLLDIPILRDQDDTTGYYFAVCGFDAGWKGAVVYESTDNITYNQVDTMQTAAAIGNALTVLEDGPFTLWDNSNTVDIQLISGTLASDTELNVLAYSNVAVLGHHGAWEIIQWQTATLIAPKTYRLGNLLRGRKGTEFAMTSHALNDVFVALTNLSINQVSTVAIDIGINKYFKAVSNGKTLAKTSYITFTDEGVCVECYSPVNIKASRDITGDITITWRRRTRYAAEWRDNVDVPLGEDTESYDIQIMDGVTVKRTFTDEPTETLIYTAAQQITDFGVVQNSIDVIIYQNSTLGGRGYPGYATL